jgi:hypothetical protein
MNRHHPRRLGLQLLLGLAVTAAGFASCPGASGSPRDPAPPEKSSYLGHLVDISRTMPRSSTRSVKIWIDRLTTDDEAAHLADLAHTRGVDALEEALGEDTVGRVQVGERTSDPIAYARRFRNGDGEHLLLISRRPIAFREFFRSARSVDYPFTVIELDLDAQGKGSGEVLTAARFRMKKDGMIELENYDFVAARLLAVKPLG